MRLGDLVVEAWRNTRLGASRALLAVAILVPVVLALAWLDMSQVAAVQREADTYCKRRGDLVSPPTGRSTRPVRALAAWPASACWCPALRGRRVRAHGDPRQRDPPVRHHPRARPPARPRLHRGRRPGRGHRPRPGNHARRAAARHRRQRGRGRHLRLPRRRTRPDPVLRPDPLRPTHRHLRSVLARDVATEPRDGRHPAVLDTDSGAHLSQTRTGQLNPTLGASFDAPLRFATRTGRYAAPAALLSPGHRRRDRPAPQTRARLLRPSA